jgi:serine/threonine protein kinase
MSSFEPISRAHAGFVDILHVGRTSRYLYYIMELADDHLTGREIDALNYAPRTLKSELERHQRLPATESIRLGLSLTEALEALHACGLTHRDIKPANIIFVDGTPKLAEIGLVAISGTRKARARRRRIFSASAKCSTKSVPEKTGSIFRNSIRG